MIPDTPPPPALVEPAPARVDLEGLRLGVAQIDRLTLTRMGDLGLVHKLKMRIPQDSLLSFLGAAIAGGPVTDLRVRPVSAHDLILDARAFGMPTHAVLALTASAGRVLMRIDSARVGWFPIPARLLRDQIYEASEAQVIKNGWIRPEGSSGLSFEPDYLFSHAVASLPLEMVKRGLPAHLQVKVRSVMLEQGYVVVDGGD